MQRRNWERFAGHSGSGGHGHEHDHTSDHSHDQGEVDGIDLFPQIDMDKVRCLNDRRSSGKCCLKPYAKRLDHRTYLLSEEDDPEVILHVPFTEGVRLAGICICADDNTNAPRNVKIFVNREDVDFGLAEDLKADLYLKDMHKDVSADVFYFPRTFFFVFVCVSLLTSRTLDVPQRIMASSRRVIALQFMLKIIGVVTRLVSTISVCCCIHLS